MDAVLDGLLLKFIERLEGEIKSLKENVDAQNWTLFESILHKLKGSAASFGLPNISRQAETLDQLSQAKQYGAISLELQALADMCVYAQQNKSA